jgi:hypothetical protein
MRSIHSSSASRVTSTSIAPTSSAWRTTAATFAPASVRLYVTFEIRFPAWLRLTMNRFGNPCTCMPWSERIPSAHRSVSVTPSRPVVSYPVRRA